jgi:hypothetical protein
LSNPSPTLFPPLIALLEADAGVVAALGGPPTLVYRTVPAAAPYPFIGLPGAHVLDVVADGFNGADVSVQVDAWSRPAVPGPEECEAIVAAICAALDGAVIDIAGYTLVQIRPVDSRVMRDPDPMTETYHGVVTLEVSADPA